MIGQHLVGLIRASINTWEPKSVYERPSQHKYTWTISSLEFELASIRLTWTVQSIKIELMSRSVHEQFTGRASVLICLLTWCISCPKSVHGQSMRRTSMLICVVSVLICILMGSTRGLKSPDQSTGRASVLSPRTNVLICVLMDSHGHPVCADRHTRTHIQPRTSCLC